MTPRGAKARAILGILATSGRHQCARDRLQKLLWSDRAHEQAAGSLRQALSEIRRALGGGRDVLGADRTTVWLVEGQVGIAEGTGLFLEDVAPRDPAFDDWVAGRRAAEAGPTALAVPVGLPRGGAPAPRPVILIHTTGATSDLSLIEDLLVDAVRRSVSETFRITVARGGGPAAAAPLLEARINAFHLPEGRIGLAVGLESPRTADILWSELARLSLRGAPEPDDPALLGLANRTTAAVEDAIRRSGAAPGMATGTDGAAALLAARAVDGIFSLQADKVAEAEALLRQAIEIEPRGLYYGWLAQLYAVQYVERFVPLSDLREPSEAACALAIESEPSNSHVLAAVATSKFVLQRNLAASGELAQLSVEANAANPLAWWALSQAQLYYGRVNEAYADARRAQSLAAGSRYRFWAELQVALTAAVRGRTHEAIRGAELSSALRPQFRPPLRYLSALYAGADMMTEAASSLKRLMAVEPDAAAERFSDPNYPVSLMRRAGLLDQAKLAEAERRLR